MNKLSSKFWTGISITVVAVMYSLVVFISKEKMDAASWIIYAFTIVSFAFLVVQRCILIQKNGSDNVVFSYTGLIPLLVYFLVQFVVFGIILMCFSGLSVVPVIIAESIWTTLYLLISFIMFGAETDAVKQSNDSSKSVQRVLIIESEIESLVDLVHDPEIKKSLKTLSEGFHYSNPVSLPGLEPIDFKLTESIALLRNAIETGDSSVEERIGAVRHLFNERQRMAKILKS